MTLGWLPKFCHLADMLDVTDRDIGDLSDSDLRELVARLSEATLRSRNLSTSYVTWGGDQDASDGGVDVRIQCEAREEIDGYIPRSAAIFQVKKPSMAPAEIRLEMRPNGALRKTISEMAEKAGAYIIVSSRSNLSDREYRNRLAAMQHAVTDHPSGRDLFVDFYDRQRLASWTRNFPSLCVWVLRKVGRSQLGWRPLEDWGFSGIGPASAFIADETPRLRVGIGHNGRSETALPILVGLQRMRTVLAQSGASVRLIGLSGVGKTRFVQALFEDAIGTTPLDPTLAVYTDLADSPEPTPTQLATQLLQQRSRSIIIVDNCPSQTHRQLTRLCRSPGSTISVLTVEYDIRDDAPEDTDVFQLEPAHEDTVSKLIAIRFPNVSQVDRNTIGRFSGGNARVGLALAGTIREGETLSRLSDADLFARLFLQRNAEDDGLLACAEACSLVYSFDAETDLSDDAEFPHLAVLADCTHGLFYRHIAELKRRGLLQSRGRWRAVLPQAIANWLAKRALENIAPQRIHEELVERSPQRLLASFSRRLSYLHDSEQARGIALDWLSASGFLGSRVKELDHLRMSLFKDISTVTPEAALEAIERVQNSDAAENFFSANNTHREALIGLVRKIAFDAYLFDRCAALLVRFAETQVDTERNAVSVFDVWSSLFSPYLSGTHATVWQRRQVISDLLRSHCRRKRQLAIEALEAALESVHFSSSHSFDFGARSRDYGYQPTTSQQLQEWYSAWIELAIDIGSSAAESALDVRKVFAQKLPDLWLRGAAHDLLVAGVETFSEYGFWSDGFIAVRAANWKHNHHYGAPSVRLEALRARLSPRTLAEQVRLHVLRDRDWILDTADFLESVAEANERADAHVENLGALTAIDEPTLNGILPDLLHSQNMRLWNFAQGLARGAKDLSALWHKLADAIRTASPEVNPSVVTGYLSVWYQRDPHGARTAIDEAIHDTRLSRIAPMLIVAVGLDARSMEQLQRALDSGVSAGAFRTLAFGRVTDTVAPRALATFLASLATILDGWCVVIMILAMTLRSESTREADRASLLQLGRTLLLDIDSCLLQTMARSRELQELDIDISVIVSNCLDTSDGKQSAVVVCQALANALTARAVSPHDILYTAPALFRVQPIIALQAFLEPAAGPTLYPTALSMFEIGEPFHNSPINGVPDSVIFEWCEENPARNYAAAATSVPFSRAAPDGVGIAWTDLAQAFFDQSPNPRHVLKVFIERFAPHMWSGSRVGIIEVNASLLVSVERSENSDLATLARNERQRLLEMCRIERQREQEQGRHLDERFE